MNNTQNIPYLTLVEKHSINKDNIFYSIYYNACLQASKIYNQALYQQRKLFFEYRDIRDKYCSTTGFSADSKEVKDYMKSLNVGLLSYPDLYKLFISECDLNVLYYSLPPALSQSILKNVCQDMNSFMKSIINNKASIDKKKVSIPRYKKHNSPSILTLTTNLFSHVGDSLKIKHNYFHATTSQSRKNKDKCLYIRVHAHKELDFISYQQVKFKVLKDKIEICVYYRKQKEVLKSDNSCYLSIDLGVNNYVTMSSNTGFKPIILNGKGLLTKIYTSQRELKRLQSIFDKTNKTSQKTTKQIQSIYKNVQNYQSNFEHHVSNYIVTYAIANNINTIVIGYNKSWKSESNLGKSNMFFQKISYTGLLHKLKYKCGLKGLNYVEVEERYTSGTSFLDIELPIKDNYNKTRRIYRGLFKSNTGKLINSDVNSSYQILKKHKKDIYDNISLVSSLYTIPLSVIVI